MLAKKISPQSAKKGVQKSLLDFNAASTQIVEEISSSNKNNLSDLNFEYDIESLKRLWQKMTKNDLSFFNEKELECGYILDATKKIALLISRKGLDLVSYLEDSKNHPFKRILYTRHEIKLMVDNALKEGLWSMQIEGIPVNPSAVDRMISVFDHENKHCSTDFELILRQPKLNEDGYWPILIINKKTRKAGIIAPNSS